MPLKRFFIFLFLWPLSAAMVFAMGLNGEGEAPPVLEEVSAEVSQVSGAVFKLNQIKIDGKTSFGGQLGASWVEIPFSQVLQAEFASQNQLFTVTLSLRDNQTVKLRLKANAQLSGQASFGKYRATLSQLLRIKF
jgi:hypothetical protein